MKSIRRNAYVIMFLLGALFLLVLPLGSDLHFHIYRIGAMAEELRRTGFHMPVRILSASYNGYGYGVPLFYGDVLMYIPAFLVLLGMSEVMSYKILVCILFGLTYISMYWQMYRTTRKKDLAFTCAVFYAFSAYYLSDLCVRASIGEATAFIFLPFVFCSFYNMVYSPKRNDWFFLAAGMSGMILPHNLTAFFSVVILFVWALIKIKTLFNNKSIGRILVAAFATLGLTASFIFPMIEAGLVQKYQTPENNGYQMQEFTKHTLDWMDFFVPYEIKKGLSSLFSLNIDTDTWHPGAVGVFLIFIIALIYIARNKKKKPALRVLFILSVMLYLYMFIEPIVTWSGRYISFMQFEWRLLIFANLGFVVYAAYLLELCDSVKLKRIYVIFAILIGLYSIGARYAYQVYLDYKGMDYIKEINKEYYEHYIMEYSPNDGDNLYLPEGVSLSLYEERGDVIKCNHEDVDFDFYRDGGKIIINVNNNPYDDTILELPLYYYKGYCAVGDIEYEVSESEDKLVEIRLEKNSEDTIEVWYAGTSIQKISDWISTMTIVVIALYYVITSIYCRVIIRQQGGIAA